MEIKKELLKTNFTRGRNGKKPEIIVIHIAEGTKLGGVVPKNCDHLGTIQEFSAPWTQKSAHYLIDEIGEILQLVEETDTAYHAGLKVRPTAKIILARPNENPNSYSIGIENVGYEGITEIQYKKTAELVANICERWLIPIDRDHIIGHREIRADKRCPGKIDIDRIVKEANDILFPPPKDDNIEIEKLKEENKSLRQLISQLLDFIANYINKLSNKLKGK